MIGVNDNTGVTISSRFQKAYPNEVGRLIVQDLPQTIESYDTAGLEPVEAMAHDIFTPAACYIKMVLHDRPNEQCRKILSKLKLVLKLGYSRILINEVVIPEIDIRWLSKSMDMLMMVTRSAAECREKQRKALVESVGLKIVDIWDLL